MTDRDTHFQGFANLLFDELLHANGYGYIEVHERHMDRDEADMLMYRKIIAQRAYDLLDHASQFVMVRPEDVPDLTAWPES